MRTPLAALQTQTERALRARDAKDTELALQQVNSSTQRLIRLSNQLLTLAKAESGSGKNPNFQPLDLVALCKQVTIEWVPLALGKEIDLGYAGAQTPAMIHGDALLLGEVRLHSRRQRRHLRR